MLTSHTINSCKKMLHDYSEFNNFIDHMLAKIQEEINESGKIEQKDKETHENIKIIRSELESLHKELKISVAARNEEKTMKDLNITLNVLNGLQLQFEKWVEEGPIEYLLQTLLTLGNFFVSKWTTTYPHRLVHVQVNSLLHISVCETKT